jgi:hypothetical protein
MGVLGLSRINGMKINPILFYIGHIYIFLNVAHRKLKNKMAVGI